MAGYKTGNKTGYKKKAGYKKKGVSNNRNYKNKRGTSGTITTLREAADRKSFSGNLFHFSEDDARQCVQNIACSPALNKKKLKADKSGYDDVACFPEWLKCKQDYTHNGYTAEHHVELCKLHHVELCKLLRQRLSEESSGVCVEGGQ